MHESTIRAAYLDWFNNWLTVESWASYHCLTVEQAESVLRLGKELHEAHCQRLKEC